MQDNQTPIPRPFPLDYRQRLIALAQDLLIDRKTSKWKPNTPFADAKGEMIGVPGLYYRWPHIATAIILNQAFAPNISCATLLEHHIVPTSSDDDAALAEKERLFEELFKLAKDKVSDNELQTLKAAIARTRTLTPEPEPVLAPTPAPVEKKPPQTYQTYAEKLEHIRAGENVTLLPGECLQFILFDRDPKQQRSKKEIAEELATKIDIQPEYLARILASKLKFTSHIIQKLAKVSRGYEKLGGEFDTPEGGFRFWTRSHYLSDDAKNIEMDMEADLTKTNQEWRALFSRAKDAETTPENQPQRRNFPRSRRATTSASRV